MSNGSRYANGSGSGLRCLPFGLRSGSSPCGCSCWSGSYQCSPGSASNGGSLCCFTMLTPVGVILPFVVDGYDRCALVACGIPPRPAFNSGSEACSLAGFLVHAIMVGADHQFTDTEENWQALDAACVP